MPRCRNERRRLGLKTDVYREGETGTAKLLIRMGDESRKKQMQ